MFSDSIIKAGGIGRKWSQDLGKERVHRACEMTNDRWVEFKGGKRGEDDIGWENTLSNGSWSDNSRHI